MTVPRGVELDRLFEKTQWDLFWLPRHVRVVDRPELLYGIAPEDRPLYNGVYRSRGDRPETLVAEVLDAHAGRRSRWLVPPTWDASRHEAALESAGFELDQALATYAISTDTALPFGDTFVAERVLGRTSLLEWHDVMAHCFGPTLSPSESEIEYELSLCSGPDPRVIRVLVRERSSGAPVSAGGSTVFPKLGVALLWSGCTLPDARGRGAYRLCLAERLAAARRAGCLTMGLFARPESSAPIVCRLGFTEGGTLRLWERAPH